jgi:hypothetical protein
MILRPAGLCSLGDIAASLKLDAPGELLVWANEDLIGL